MQAVEKYKDSQYASYVETPYRHPEIEHKYGDKVHILKNPVLLTQLGFLSSRDSRQPALSAMLNELYSSLIRIVINQEFPLKWEEIKTRMYDQTEMGILKIPIINPSTKVVVIEIPRAGTEPALICYNIINRTLDPRGVRKDTLEVSRKVDSQGRIIGAELYKAKIGGPVKDRILIIPDPMGATGSTLCTVLDEFKKEVGEYFILKIISLNLIITPEFIRNVHSRHPECVIYAVRLDRGLSDDAVFGSLPGTFWEREKGLNDHGYIVPGAGGLGEVLTGSEK
jgi:uracil phosphoribosyltransferase